MADDDPNVSSFTETASEELLNGHASEKQSLDKKPSTSDDLDEQVTDLIADKPLAGEKSSEDGLHVYCSFNVVNNGVQTTQDIFEKDTTSAKKKIPVKYTPKQKRDNIAIERANLVGICKLVIKQLIDSSISHGYVVEDDLDPLTQFFVVMEHILFHGIKLRKGLLRDRTDCWSILENMVKFAPDASDMVTSVKEMTHVKSSLGRVRAWLRLAMMQKKLPDYFRLLVDRKDQLLLQSYETGALLLADEAGVISGLLVGLNVIDCNCAIKDDDLDQPMGVIDFSLYLKEIISPCNSVQEDENESFHKVATILDQKNYLEELNRHLTSTISNLNQKMEAIQVANTLMKEEVENTKSSVVQLQQENSMLRCESNALLEGHQRQLQTAQQDIQIERETYQQSRQGLDCLYQEAKKKLNEEIQTRLDVEKELLLQIGMKQEIEVALRLLEKDIHEKQDVIISLRNQLDEIKAINLDMHTKLQSAESALQHKVDMVSRLELKTSQMVETIRDMEDEMKRSQAEKRATDETARKLGLQIADKDSKRQTLETDLRIEREWRGSLQKNLEQEKGKTSRLQTEIQHLLEVKREHESLQSRHLQMKQLCEEQEKALAELGSHLSQSKLKMEDLKEAQQMMKEAQWADDREVNDCKQCNKPFSVSRRKHHCRNCGEIFCNECSSTKMPLPSSAKPVRVCDDCSTKLLQRYSAN